MNKLLILVLCLSAAFGIWALIAGVAGVIAAGGISNALLAWMTSVGLTGEIVTLVGFYTHIKGIEYIICVSFLVAFPFFTKYLNGHGNIQQVQISKTV